MLLYHVYPVDRLRFVEEVLERDHEEKHPAESGYRTVHRFEQVAVLGRVIENEGGDKEGGGGHRDAHDEYRQYETGAEDSEENAPGEEPPLPQGTHALQNARIHHGIVKRESDLKRGQYRNEQKCVEAKLVPDT